MTLNAANIRFIFHFPNIMRKYLLINNLKYNDSMTKVANNYSSFSSRFSTDSNQGVVLLYSY